MQGEKRAVIYHLVRHKASAFELKQSPDGISFGVSCVETRTICNALQSVWCVWGSRDVFIFVALKALFLVSVRARTTCVSTNFQLLLTARAAICQEMMPRE